LQVDTNVSEKYTISIFSVEDGSVPKETKVAGNRSAQLRSTAVSQQSSPEALCVTYNLSESHSKLNLSSPFY
jgi:hypothetical protein